MQEYYLFNHAALNSFQGQTLIFHANGNKHAIELGADYAHKLGWANYSICRFDGENEITIY